MANVAIPGTDAVIVQQGKTLDYIDGLTQRKETPEEYVRQEIAKSLVREYGFQKNEVGVEFTLRLGSRRPRADLVIFDEGAPHAQDRARVIIECKSDKTKASARKDGVGQLHSYMAACPNVRYGMWTNGVERFCYRRANKDGAVSFDEIPDIPGKGRSEEEIERPRFDQLKAALSDALLFAFRRCHNYIAGNQGLQKPEAFWELLKIIFCKIHDERQSQKVEFYATAKERDGLNGRLKAKKRLDKLFDDLKTDYPTIFRPNEAIELNPEVLAYIVSQLQMYSLLESDIDVKGRAYEEIVGSNLRGDRGEFFTPRNICQMAVAMLDPSEGDLIVDPACGTAGFLITAMNHVVEKIRAVEAERWGDIARAESAVGRRVRRFAQKYVVGMDLNPNLVKASKMNMVMNNDGTGGLFQANSLRTPVMWEDDLRGRNLIGRVDLLFTNPPFGSKIPIDDPSILEDYDLGHIWRYDDESDSWTMTERVQSKQPPEILFIRRDWPWHKVRSASLPASLLFGGARRMEAEGLLGSGFGTRMTIEAKRSGWVQFEEIARAWQPPRLRGIKVSPQFGTPFLTASQVFDLAPIPRKWLSLEHTEHAQERFVVPGTILVTCSGTVGRTTLARNSLNGILISHDILRVAPSEGSYWGWLYAYLRAPSVIGMMQAAHYGHVVKHLEVDHLRRLPVVEIDARARRAFTRKAGRIADNRNRAEELMAEANALLASAFRLPRQQVQHSTHNIARVSDVSAGRRRLEGAFHAANVKSLLRRLDRRAVRVERVGDVVTRVWWMTRFSRRFGEGGAPYMSADELFSISQIAEKRVHLDPIPNHEEFFVREGWLLMACSGQVYGLNGSVTLATKHDEGFFFSHDLIRIAPRSDAVRPGYLFAYLGHRALGRILAQRVAYGSSVPHIDPGDVEDIPVGRLTAQQENEIADLAEEASRLNAAAAELERAIGRQADEVVKTFLA